METAELIKVIFTSSVIAAIISTIVSFIVSIKLKHLDYKNEYFKTSIEKRLIAYGYLENQIAVLKGVAVDKDTNCYHQIFSYGSDKVQ